MSQKNNYDEQIIEPGQADPIDYRNLLLAIMNQAIDDYIKLQHPTTRNKKYLHEFYLTAIDFLFDNEYRLNNVKNEHGEDMSVKELIGEVLESERPDIKRLQAYAIQRTLEYWGEKDMAVLDHIPDTVCVGGQTFAVEQAYIKSYAIDLDAKTITLDKKLTPVNATNFLEAILAAITLLSDITIKASVVRTLAKEMYWVLKTNNMFSYCGVASENELFLDQRS